MKKIKINETELILKYSFRGFFVYENLTDRSFRFGKMMDEFILFYSMLLANNEGFTMPFEEFMEICDKDFTLYETFKAFIVEALQAQAQGKEQQKGETKKKKRSASGNSTAN